MGRVDKQRPTAEQALQILLEGNNRFISGNLEHPNHCEESRKKNATGQEPIATILTCVDSLVPPVDIFDQGIGDLVDNAAKELVRDVACQLTVSEPIIADYYKDAKVNIVPAFYDFSTGKATFLED